MSIVGKSIASEEKWENDDDELNIHHFLTTTTCEIFHLMIINGYDQYNTFKLITLEEKLELISQNNLEKIE